MGSPIHFQKTITIQPADIDALGHVNNVVYVRWAQEVAAAHWQTAGDEMLSRYSWVVLRHEVDYYQPTFLTDEVTAHTWVGNYDGAKSDRYVRFLRAGKTVCEVRSTWCLLDSKSMRPQRVPREIQSVFHADGQGTGFIT